eukprot:6434939-Amphidinium_carterae.1
MLFQEHILTLFLTLRACQCFGREHYIYCNGFDVMQVFSNARKFCELCATVARHLERDPAIVGQCLGPLCSLVEKRIA